MIRDLTTGLMKLDSVYGYRGFVTAANLAENVLFTQ
jgi:hypothetical protein